jgi:hypothetical protein
MATLLEFATGKVWVRNDSYTDAPGAPWNDWRGDAKEGAAFLSNIFEGICSFAQEAVHKKRGSNTARLDKFVGQRCGRCMHASPAVACVMAANEFLLCLSKADLHRVEEAIEVGA